MSKILTSILALLGYRLPPRNLTSKRNEKVVSVSLFVSFIIYYLLTISCIRQDTQMNDMAFFSWFVSMFITAMDNIKRLVTGMNRFNKLTRYVHPPKHKQYSPPSTHTYEFHSGFYVSILYIELLGALLILLLHESPLLHATYLEVEKILMIVLTIVFMAQSLTHTLVDLYNMDDIEEIR